MSRVGNRIIKIPTTTTVSVDNHLVKVSDKLGTLSRQFPPSIQIAIAGDEISLTRANDEKKVKQLHGTFNSLLAGMIKGVSEGFQKEIEIRGVGYSAKMKGDHIEINAGYSHPVFIKIIKDVKIEIPKPVQIIISGVEKQRVGQMAALIKKVRKVSAYSGKGIIYKGEKIRRKEGKTVTK